MRDAADSWRAARQRRPALGTRVPAPGSDASSVADLSRSAHGRGPERFPRSGIVEDVDRENVIAQISTILRDVDLLVEIADLGASSA